MVERHWEAHEYKVLPLFFFFFFFFSSALWQVISAYLQQKDSLFRNTAKWWVFDTSSCIAESWDRSVVRPTSELLLHCLRQSWSLHIRVLGSLCREDLVELPRIPGIRLKNHVRKVFKKKKRKKEKNVPHQAWTSARTFSAGACANRYSRRNGVL